MRELTIANCLPLHILTMQYWQEETIVCSCTYLFSELHGLCGELPGRRKDKTTGTNLGREKEREGERERGRRGGKMFRYTLLNYHCSCYFEVVLVLKLPA